MSRDLIFLYFLDGREMHSSLSIQSGAFELLGELVGNYQCVKDEGCKNKSCHNERLNDEDVEMVNSSHNFNPVILGVARSGGRILVRQSGALLFETNVAPGAFFVDELYVSLSADDLQVTVQEYDGTKQCFSVPYTPAH